MRDCGDFLLSLAMPQCNGCIADGDGVSAFLVVDFAMFSWPHGNRSPGILLSSQWTAQACLGLEKQEADVTSQSTLYSARHQEIVS